MTSDAECSATIDDPVWRRQRCVLDGDDFDVLLDRGDVRLAPLTQPDPDEECDPVSHSYSWVLRPQETRPVNLRLDDREWRDNTGSLQVRIEKVPPVVGPEAVSVDSAVASGARTARVYPAGQPVVLRVTGSYAFAPGITADAECSRTTTDATWRTSRTELTGVDGRPLGDLTVNGRVLDWVPTAGYRSCEATGHSYRLRWTPQTTGPLVLAVADTRHTDNAGILSVTVEPAG